MKLRRLALAATIPAILAATTAPAHAEDVARSVTDPSKDAAKVVDVTNVNWHYSDVEADEKLTATAQLVKLTDKTTVSFMFKRADKTFGDDLAEFRVRVVNGVPKVTRYTNGKLKFGPQPCGNPKPITWDKETDAVTLTVPGDCLTLDGTGNFDSKFWVKTSHSQNPSSDKTKTVRIEGAFLVSYS